MTKTWVTGDIITAVDMNRIESGVLPVVTFTLQDDESVSCDTAYEDAANIRGACITVVKAGDAPDYRDIASVTVNMSATGNYVTFTSYSIHLNTGEMSVRTSLINLYEDGHVTDEEKAATVPTN